MLMCAIFGDVRVRLGMANNAAMSRLNNRAAMIRELREEFE